jgi:hypothetical protein
MNLEKLREEIIRKVNEKDDMILLYTINQMLGKYSNDGSIYEVKEGSSSYNHADTEKSDLIFESTLMN